MLEEGYASRASDIDVIYCYGFGFPAISRRPDVLRRYRRPSPPCSRESASTAERFGDYWKPAPLLEKLVAEGHGFYTTRR